ALDVGWHDEDMAVAENAGQLFTINPSWKSHAARQTQRFDLAFQRGFERPAAVNLDLELPHIPVLKFGRCVNQPMQAFLRIESPREANAHRAFMPLLHARFEHGHIHPVRNARDVLTFEIPPGHRGQSLADGYGPGRLMNNATRQRFDHSKIM